MIDDLPWTEKHRPDTLDDVAGNEAIIEVLKRWVDEDSYPDVILSGPAGTGKTTAVVAFAREKFGDNMAMNFKEMNASDERGIDIIRDQIKGYAEQEPAGDASHKIIFLDEADSLTKEAMAALRRPMEDYSEKTRFFLSCNYPNNIIDPIQSRCTTFRFKRLSNEELKGVLQSIAEKEDLDYEDSQLDDIIDLSRGDARRAVRSLQSVAYNGSVDDVMIEAITTDVDRDVLESTIELSMSGELDDAQEQLADLLKSGVDTGTLSKEYLWTLRGYDMPEQVRTKAFHLLAEAEYRSNIGSNPHVQFNAFLANLNLARHAGWANYE